jgi:hypothetical protein
MNPREQGQDLECVVHRAAWRSTERGNPDALQTVVPAGLAPVEQAMLLIEQPVSFQEMFQSVEQDDEETVGTAEVLGILRRPQFAQGFTSNMVADMLNIGDLPGDDSWCSKVKTGLEQTSGKLLPVISSTTVAWRLKAIVDAPVQVGDKVLVLQWTPHHEGGMFAVDEVVVKKDDVPF